MDYAAAATNAPATAPAPPPASGTDHAQYPHPYAGYSYPYGAYYQQAPPTYPSAAAPASSSYYYPVPAAVPPTAAHYDPYSGYQYYNPPEGGGAAAGAGLAGYYFTAGEASQQAAATSTTRVAPAATTKEAGKQFGFDPQRYTQAAVARASNGITQSATAPGMHHAEWNANFGHPVPKYVLRKQIKKKPKAVQPAPCEVCKIQCDTLEVLLIHKQGRKHKKNLEKLQDSITPKPIIKPPSNVTGSSMAMAPDVSNCVMPSVQSKKKKSCTAATPEGLEVKKRRVLEAGAAQNDVRICGVCNVVVNSQKVYEFHIAGQKHQAMMQKQQALHFVT